MAITSRTSAIALLRLNYDRVVARYGVPVEV
jgi:hypothetical protein